MKKFLISSIIFPILILIAAACAPARTVTSEPIETVTSPTQTLEAPEIATLLPPTPVETEIPPTPEAKYLCPTNPEMSMTRLSLKDDIQSGKLAKWVMSLPESKVKISNDPAALDFAVDRQSDHSVILGAQSSKIKGWGEKYTTYIGMCKINPSEFGLLDKNDAVIVITVAQDKNDLRVPQFTLASIEEAKKLYYGYLQDPNNGISIASNLGSGFNVDLIAEGAKPQGPDDIRQLASGEFLFAAQGKDVKDIEATLVEVENTEAFSIDAQNTYRTSVFLTTVYRDLKPQEP